MAPKLYVGQTSAAVRAVYFAEKALGLNLEKVRFIILDGEHLAEEFVKINPQHTVPTLVEEDGTVIWDSHAIMAYLVGQYGKDDSLYPKDLKKRALVDQRLHFDTGIAFMILRRILEPILFRGSKTIPEEDKQYAHNSTYSFLEKFLEGKKWVCGDNITIADFSLISTITTLIVVVPLENKYKNIAAWLKRAEELPYYEVNRIGVERIAEMIKQKLS